MAVVRRRPARASSRAARSACSDSALANVSRRAGWGDESIAQAEPALTACCLGDVRRPRRSREVGSCPATAPGRQFLAALAHLGSETPQPALQLLGHFADLACQSSVTCPSGPAACSVQPVQPVPSSREVRRRFAQSWLGAANGAANAGKPIARSRRSRCLAQWLQLPPPTPAYLRSRHGCGRSAAAPSPSRAGLV